MEGEKPTLVITGVSGYIGSQICLYFLKTGQFKVRGTVRSTKREDKIAPLRKAFGEYFDQLELFEADLGKPESIHACCEGQKYLVHTASPYQLAEPKDENELVGPAVAGTIAAMEGAKKHGVKRVVITSSCYSIIKDQYRKQRKFTPQDWSYSGKGQDAYAKSKTLAEKAAWDFLEKLPENERFELVAINPGMVLGPNLIPGGFQSGQIVKNMITGAWSKLPDITVPLVDVRDVAQAHVNGILVPEAAGRRFILGQAYGMLQIGKDLHAVYSKEWKKCPNKPIPRLMVRFASWFNKEMRDANREWKIPFEFVNDDTKNILGVQFTDPTKSAVDMVPTLIEHGQITKPGTKAKK